VPLGRKSDVLTYSEPEPERAVLTLPDYRVPITVICNPTDGRAATRWAVAVNKSLTALPAHAGRTGTLLQPFRVAPILFSVDPCCRFHSCEAGVRASM
jgi:hypothetical protein